MAQEKYEVIKKINRFIEANPKGEGIINECFLIDLLKELLPYLGVNALKSCEIEGNYGIDAEHKGVIFLEGVRIEDGTPEEFESRKTPYYHEWYVIKPGEIAPYAFDFDNWRSAIYCLTNLRFTENDTSISSEQKMISDYA